MGSSRFNTDYHTPAGDVRPASSLAFDSRPATAASSPNALATTAVDDCSRPSTRAHPAQELFCYLADAVQFQVGRVARADTVPFQVAHIGYGNTRVVRWRWMPTRAGERIDVQSEVHGPTLGPSVGTGGGIGRWRCTSGQGTGVSPAPGTGQSSSG